LSAALLDVNVLIALLDGRPVHHGGTLVSFDPCLDCGAVVGGSDALQLFPT
jgi:hypothetical protein